MSEEFVTHIFEPFEREKNTTISGIQGTGLGMAITKNIVDMMNGSITVRSREGVGTEFTVAFTFRLNTENREPKELPQFKDLRALVVDDDFNTCDSVSYMLQQIGMRAEWTLSGKEAVLRTRQAVMRGNDYSVYVIDWMLPDMNGIEVTRRIRKEMGRGRYRSLSSLHMTGRRLRMRRERPASLHSAVNRCFCRNSEAACIRSSAKRRQAIRKVSA